MSAARTNNASSPPGAFPLPTTTTTTATAASKNKKKKKSKAKKAGTDPNGPALGHGGYHSDDDDLPPLEDVDEASPPGSTTIPLPFTYSPHPSATPSDLLSTASDLYRQIEAAAASALSTHPSFAASFPPPPSSGPGGANASTDEAYWTSLPQHLRQFIRSALPLAAGLTTGPNGQLLPLPNGTTQTSLGATPVTGANGQTLPPLTHDQLSSAAAQLAQVVQSNWGQLGLGPMPPGAGNNGGGARAPPGQNGATISLGSFPVTMPTREQMEAAIGSIGALGGDLGMGMGLPGQATGGAPHLHQQQQHPIDYIDETEDEDAKDGTELSKSKKKKQKKKKQQQQAAGAAQAAALAAQAEFDRVKSPPPPPPPAPTSRLDNHNHGPPSAAPPRAPNSKSPAPASKPQTTAAGKQPAPQQYYSEQPALDPYTPTVPTHKLTSTPSIAPKAGPSSERERIRDFWLGLQENERRALVKVEKEAVLRKMKEQQRSGCSCAVCGRKRSAIEEELEVLYDAYYDELESYALHQVRYASAPPGTVAAPPGPGPFPGSVDAAVAPTTAPPVAPVKKVGGIVKPTRDHKNVRPAAVKKKPPPPPPPAPNSATQTNGGHNHHHHHHHHDGPAHGEPGHTHSPSCPHHPHNHSTHPPTSQAKAKGAAVVHHDDHGYDDEEGDEGDEGEEGDEGDEDDEEYDEDEYDDDEDEEEYDDDEEAPRDDTKKAPHARRDGDNGGGETADFFGFGKSLTVKGGILTVADDLLKNDGQKFLEMMEQLADKRIQRERDAAGALRGLGSDGGASDDGSEEYDEDEEDDEDDEDEEEDDDEVMTEAERMEEGRRMFQIFAARMFEQRVLTAYREKVASERQLQLLREIEAEERLAEEKELKKAKENQKKKDKKKDQKQKKEEERLRKEAERIAAEQAAKQAEDTRLEEERRRNEEARQKREADRRHKEEERQKKEEKLRIAKEEERLKKEEKSRLAKEARLAAEKEAREKKARDDAERKAKEAADKKEREEREEKERLARVAREAEAEKERVAAVAAAKAQAAAALAASRAKQQQTPKSPVPARGAANVPAKSHSIPGLPKTPVAAAAASPSSTKPVAIPPQQPSSRVPAYPSGNAQRQPSISGGHQAPPHVQSPQQLQSPQQQSQRPAGLPQQQQQQMPPFAQRQPSGQHPQQGLNGTAPQQSRMFPPSAIGQPSQQQQQQQQQLFGGNLGMSQQPTFMPHPQPQQHPQTHISPVLGRNAPIGPSPSSSVPTSIAPGSSSTPSAVPTAIGAPSRAVSGSHSSSGPNGLVSPSPLSPIAPPGVGSATSPRPINIGPIGGIIGRPSSSVSSHRSTSPPPRVFGSSALLEDDEIVVPSQNHRGSSTSADWSSPFGGGIWGAPAIPAPIVTPDRNSVIRDRARVSYLKLDELSNGTNAPIPIGDIHRALITLWPDSVSVDLKELVESMLLEGDLLNGGGRFQFTQSGDGLYAQFLN